MIIAGGLAVVGALSGLVNAISVLLVSIAAGAGALAIYVEIMISIVVFVGLSVASPKIQQWAAERKRDADINAAIRASGKYQAAQEVFLKNLKTSFD